MQHPYPMCVKYEFDIKFRELYKNIIYYRVIQYIFYGKLRVLKNFVCILFSISSLAFIWVIE